MHPNGATEVPEWCIQVGPQRSQTQWCLQIGPQKVPSGASDLGHRDPPPSYASKWGDRDSRRVCSSGTTGVPEWCIQVGPKAHEWCIQVGPRMPRVVHPSGATDAPEFKHRCRCSTNIQFLYEYNNYAPEKTPVYFLSSKLEYGWFMNNNSTGSWLVCVYSGIGLWLDCGESVNKWLWRWTFNCHLFNKINISILFLHSHIIHSFEPIIDKQSL